MSYSRIVDKLLAKHPDGRYPTAQAILSDLMAAQSNETLSFSFSDRSVPQLSGETLLPGDLEELLPNGWTHRIWIRVMDFFFEPSPELYHRLQTTQRKVDGAVAACEARHQKLHDLVQESDGVLAMLRDQFDQWMDAERRLSENTDPISQAKYESFQANIVDISDQIKQKSQQRDEIQHQCQQVEAKLQQIQHQRDRLNARLGETEAQLKLAGVSGETQSPNSLFDWAKRHWLGILLVILGGIILWRAALRIRPSTEAKAARPSAKSAAQSQLRSLVPFSTTLMM
jgi:hypothetical protein